jgi:hypothetical protein
MTNSPLNILVSCFANVKGTEPRPVNLLTWLTSDKYKQEVDIIRQTEDKDARATLKQRLPAITPSGQFTKRNLDGLVNHSGLLCIDIDYQDNKHIGNYSELKKHLCNIKNFAYVGLSVSGNGFYCLMPISQPDKHKLHFKAIQTDMERFGIVVDKSGSDITRLRFYSYDDEAHFNHEAKVYSKIYQEPEPLPKPQQTNNKQNDGISKDEPLDIVVNMVRGSRDGEKHVILYRAARLAGGYISGGQLDEATATNALEDAIRNKRNVHSLEDAFKTIKDGIDNGKNSPIKKPEEEVKNVENVNNVKNVIMSNVQKKKNRRLNQRQRLQSKRPLKKASGRLAELEDIFFKDKAITKRLNMDKLIHVVKIFDYCKRTKPTPELIAELESILLIKQKPPAAKRQTRGFNFTDIAKIQNF